MTRLDWQDQALCAQVGGDTWFPDKGESSRAAKQVCRSCPVQRECLTYALTTGVAHGVYGGRTYSERLQFQHSTRGTP